MTEARVPSDIFRAYDIRGIVGEGLTCTTLRLIGRAIGSEALDEGERSLLIGADSRLSSPDFKSAMIEGLCSTGIDVIDIGTVPSPLLYYATHTLASRSGVMITGSHNPADYNGVKIVLRRQCLADQQIQALKTRIRVGDFREGQGTLQTVDIRDDYIARITKDISLRRRFRVVIDAGNGVTGLVAPALFRALGCEVVPLYCEPDGHFPHHHPDPTIAANLRDLQARVEAEKADLGIAFDGDGDRVGIVSESGRIIDADKLLLIFARDILPDNPGARVVFDVKSSFHLPRTVEALGGESVFCKSGHSFVKRCLQDSGALLGGEFSAHIFFNHRWYGFDDGLYTAARFLEVLDRRRLDVDALLAELPASVSTPEMGIPVPEEGKFALMERLAEALQLPGARINALDGIRADYPAGWGLLRASNTTPKLVCRFEADSETELARIQSAFRDELVRLAPDLVMPF